MGHDAEGSAKHHSYMVFLLSLRQGIGEDDHACLFVSFWLGTSRENHEFSLQDVSEALETQHLRNVKLYMYLQFR